MEPLEEKNTTVTINKNKINTVGAIMTAGLMIAFAILISHASAGTTAQQPTPQQQAVQPADSTQVSTAGDPFIGDANAPVTMDYWFDYQCPFCNANEQQTMPQVIQAYVATGKLKIVFKDYQFLGPDSQTLGKIARAVWSVDPAKFYQWHQAIFAHQGTENTGWATPSLISSITTAVLGATEAKQVATLAATNDTIYQQALDADKAEGTRFGISGTPGFIIGKQSIVGAQKYDQFKNAIEIALQGK